MNKKHNLLDEYRFPGYRPKAGIKGKFGDPQSRIIVLKRLKKKQHAGVVELNTAATMTGRIDLYGIYPVAKSGYTWKLKYGVSNAGSAGK